MKHSTGTVNSLNCLTNTERKLKCCILHCLKTEDIFYNQKKIQSSVSLVSSAINDSDHNVPQMKTKSDT